MPEIVDRILPPGILGRYVRDENRIELDPRQSDAQYRCTLAHEWTHWLRGDECTGDSIEAQKREAIVDRIVARQLITLDNLLDALRAYPRDPAAVAEQLHVDLHTLNVRMTTLEPLERSIVGRHTQGECA